MHRHKHLFGLRFAVVVVSVAGALAVGGCRAAGGAKGDTPTEKKSVIQSEMDEALQEFYAAQPDGKEKIAKAAGYGYFSNVNVNVLLMSTENGYGVVHDNATGKDTYMKMAGAGVGLGLGVKDYRAVYIFNDPQVMKDFVEKGVTAGGSADAAAKTNTEGKAAGAEATVSQGMEVYQFTKQGLALQATVGGAKYWRDDSLNAP